MEQNNKKIMFFAIVTALITTLLIFVYLNKAQPTNRGTNSISIWVAAKTINAKAAISEQDLKEVKIDRSMINKNALTKKSDILNKVTKEAIYEGEQILKTRLAGKDNSSLAYLIPKGKRAITINVNEASSVGYFVKPGDYVDIIVTLQKEIQEERDKQIVSPRMSRTLLQNVLVLGVGQTKEATEKPTIAGNNTKGAAPVPTAPKENKTVTLAVTQEDAEKVAIAEEAGILRLTLRPVGDERTLDTHGVTKDNLVPSESKSIIYR